MVADSEFQRIARLTPLADVLASFDLSIGPVAPREEALAAALGLTLAADVVIAGRPSEAALALRDGYAVRADATTDASSYAPAPLSPAPQRVDTGEALPAGADAVAALDAVQMRGGTSRSAGRGRAGRRRAAGRRRRRRRRQAAAVRRAAAPDRRRAAVDARHRARDRSASRACAWCAPAQAKSSTARRR